MDNIIRKLTSRKLWMAIAGVATGVAMAFGADGSDITAIAGAVTTIISTVTFIIMEGKIDAERVKTAIESGQTIVNVLQDDEPNVVTGFGGDGQ